MASHFPHAKYDLFISYRMASHDRPWVRLELFPALTAAGLRVILADHDFVPGRYVDDEMVRANALSKHTLCVLTPAYLAGKRLAHFELNMARLDDPTGSASKVIPMLLAAVTMPPSLDGRIAVDWTNKDRLQSEWNRLMRLVGGRPDSAPPLDLQSFVRLRGRKLSWSAVRKYSLWAAVLFIAVMGARRLIAQAYLSNAIQNKNKQPPQYARALDDLRAAEEWWDWEAAPLDWWCAAPLWNAFGNLYWVMGTGTDAPQAQDWNDSLLEEADAAFSKALAMAGSPEDAYYLRARSNLAGLLYDTALHTNLAPPSASANGKLRRAADLLASVTIDERDYLLKLRRALVFTELWRRNIGDASERWLSAAWDAYKECDDATSPQREWSHYSRACLLSLSSASDVFPDGVYRDNAFQVARRDIELAITLAPKSEQGRVVSFCMSDSDLAWLRQETLSRLGEDFNSWCATLGLR